MAGIERFLVRFWGVRGSYPTPGPETLRHGGNTSCIEVQAGAETIIFDAGSGIIGLGHALMERAGGATEKPLRVSLFITHGHGDHLVGFPFFAPLFDPQAEIFCFGPSLTGMDIEQVVTPLMSPPYFPVDIRKLPSRRSFYTITGHEQIVWRQGGEPEVEERQQAVGNDEVRVFAQLTQSHPLDGAALYRVEYAGHSVVYATDVEWDGECDPHFIAFAEGADVLIHDAQYTTDDYQQFKHGFGHSTIDMATGAARAAQVGQLILFHHEPTYDDQQLDHMEAEARAQFPRTRSAYEGMEIDVLASGTERG